MDFTKFVAMLENSGVFFPTGRNLKAQDPFEGSYPRANHALRPAIYEKGYASVPAPEGGAAMGREFARLLTAELQKAPNFMLVSCWHWNQHESAAMWRLYAKSNEAIAIRTRLCRLQEELTQHDRIILGLVSYVDYAQDFAREGNIYDGFMSKRKSFEHERELRAVYMADSTEEGQATSEGGRWFNVDLNNLVEEVYVAPTAPPWFKKLVEACLARYDLPDVVVRQSSLDDSNPVY